jgi:uncharacterized protein YjbI with pentapeptide repeats
MKGMNETIIEDKTFKGTDYSKAGLALGDYEHCSFINCDFSNSNLSKISFTGCKFEQCNLTMAILRDTSMKTVSFINCKLLGLHFKDCNTFLLSLNFDGCLLNLTSFYKLRLKKTAFKNCSIQESDFTESDLMGSLFDNCDLSGAIFQNTLLERADFRTAWNYSIDPELNRVKKAKFSINGLAGLLGKYDLEIY